MNNFRGPSVRSKAVPFNVLLIVTVANCTKEPKPFRFDNENNSYAYLSELCARNGLRLHVSHFKNYLEGSRIFSWTHEEGEWVLGEHSLSEMDISYADLPQNYAEANIMRGMLLAEDIAIINDLELSDSLTDKMRTYGLFPEFMAPAFDVSEPDLLHKINKLRLHSDLIKDQFILKPRYGERGKGIEIIGLKDLHSPGVLNRKGYIIQPLIESKSGIPALKVTGRHDLRMMVCNGDILQFFIRKPAPDSFVSNKAHGGKLFYYELSELPQQMIALAKKVDKRLSKYTPRMYSIDVGVGESGKVWIYELNTMPGIVWEEESKLDKKKNMEIHHALVDMIQAEQQKTLEKNECIK